ncbi:hypothetical protein GCM10022248_90420 [Nonomuraea soli]
MGQSPGGALEEFAGALVGQAGAASCGTNIEGGDSSWCLAVGEEDRAAGPAFEQAGQ